MSDRILLAIPNVGDAEARNLKACIDENFVSTVGRFVGELEEKCADISGTSMGVATAAGTQALHMSLRALNIGADDLVILPSFTFIASANAIRHSGAMPWLMDISNDWTLCPEAVSRALEANCTIENGQCIHRPTGKRVAAMMPVYTLGTPADMSALNAIAKRWHLKTIADAAAAIGVSIAGAPIGEFADATCYSFNGNKTITCGGGGMIVGNDETMMKRAKHLTTTARVPPNYDHDEVGYNYRMTNLEAAVGCAQMGKLDDFLIAKQRIRKAYNTAFADRAGIVDFPAPAERTSTCWFSGFVFEDPKHAVSTFCEHLNAYNIEARPFWKPVHLQVPYKDAPYEDMSKTESLWNRIVTLPCSTSLSASDQDRVIECTLRALDEMGVS